MAKYNPDLKELLEYLRYMHPRDVKVLRDEAKQLNRKRNREEE